MPAVSRAEFLASLSLTVDLGLGQPMEHVLRQTVLAARLAEAAGFGVADREATYYLSLLAWVGCTADSSELARLFGDDMGVRAASYTTDLSGLPLLSFMVRNAGKGSAPLRRVALVAEVVTTKVAERAFITHCDSAALFAHRLGVAAPVADAMAELFERWDGKGTPRGLRGDAIAPAVRAVQLADVVEVHDRLGGVRAAADVARARRGTMFDPTLVDLFADNADEFLRGLDDSSWDEVLRSDPNLGIAMTDEELDDALAAAGDYADLKSPTRAGHSRGVAELVAGAAAEFGLPVDAARELRRAASVHDLGTIGVSNAVWDTPGPLSATDRERVRTHPYLSERTLARSPGLAPIGRLAAAHHERIDGSGYPAGLSGDALSPAARLLAAADVYHALREPRPHRDALGTNEAATHVREEVRAGRLDGEAVRVVLGAAGHRRRRRADGPAGLTAREIEVLTLLARGARNRDIAQTLGIAVKTVSAHLERIYAKAGVTSRTAATLFAIRNGLLSLEDTET